MAIKTFTAGEVLTASDTNTFLANSGLVYVNSFSTTGNTVLTCDNVFTSAYKNYRVFINMQGVSNINVLLMTYINSSGSDVISSYYSAAMGWDITGSSGTPHIYNSTSSVALAFLSSTSFSERTMVAFDIADPFNAVFTPTAGNYSGVNSGAYWSAGLTNSQQLGNTSMRGFKLKSSVGTNIVGSATVYGYRIP